MGQRDRVLLKLEKTSRPQWCSSSKTRGPTKPDKARPWVTSVLEMLKKYRWEELGDLIPVPVFDATMRGGLSRGQLQHHRKAGMGFLKEKVWGFVRGKGRG